MSFLKFFNITYKGKGGVQELIKISFPMFISLGCESLMMFTDRYLLSDLGKVYPSASMVGGFSSFLLSIFFVGLLGYINPLSAQFWGSGDRESAFNCSVQGLLISILVAPIIYALGLIWAPAYFKWAAIPAEECTLAISYFNVINSGVIFLLIKTSFASLYAGLGKTKFVMKVNIVGLLLNIPLSYFLINGFGPQFLVAEKGAAAATIFSTGVMCVLFFYIFIKEKRRENISSKVWKVNKNLMYKLFKYGGPNGLEFFLLFFCFNTFVNLFHSYGVDQALAVTIVFNWDVLAFMPVWGLSHGQMGLVGQAMGRKDSHLAAKITRSSLFVSLLVMLGFSGSFFLVGEKLIDPFLASGLSINEKLRFVEMTLPMLRLMSLYLISDAVYVVVSGTLRAAGETKICLYISLILQFSMLILSYLSIRVFQWDHLVSWIIFVFVVILMSFIFSVRYRMGCWKNVQII